MLKNSNIESQEQLKDLDPTKIQFITSINDFSFSVFKVKMRVAI